jgi:hypothetical protein
MPDLTLTEIKAILVTAAVPSQAQWHAIMDSIFNKLQAATDTAAAAEDDVAEAVDLIEGMLPVAMCRVRRTNVAGINAWRLDFEKGCTVTLTGTQQATFTMTFDTPITDAKYIALEKFMGTGTLCTIGAELDDSITAALKLIAAGSDIDDTFMIVVFA